MFTPGGAHMWRIQLWRLAIHRKWCHCHGGDGPYDPESRPHSDQDICSDYLIGFIFLFYLKISNNQKFSSGWFSWGFVCLFVCLMVYLSTIILYIKVPSRTGPWLVERPEGIRTGPAERGARRLIRSLIRSPVPFHGIFMRPEIQCRKGLIRVFRKKGWEIKTLNSEMSHNPVRHRRLE